MTTEEFFVNLVFKDLDYTRKEDDVFLFKGDAFKEMIERCAQNGIGIYKILVWNKEEVEHILSHEQFLKKATDLRWAKTAFFKHIRENADYQFSANFKISEKLLERAALFVPKVKESDEEE